MMKEKQKTNRVLTIVLILVSAELLRGVFL